MPIPDSLYRQVLDQRQKKYNAALASNEITPFLYPWDFIPSMLLFLGLVVASRLPYRLPRAYGISTFILMFALSIYRMTQCRMLGFAGGYLVGLIFAWGLIITFTLLVIHDPSKDFFRLETRESQSTEVNGPNNKSDISSGMANGSPDLRKRKVYGMNSTASLEHQSGASKPATSAYTLVWQPMPHDFWHFLDWSIDLMTSFRGVNWNYRISSLPRIDIPLPDTPSVGMSASEREKNASKATAVPLPSLRQLQRRAFRDSVVFYVALDLLKTCMTTDLYFLGIEPLISSTPWPWLAALNQQIPIATRFTRLVISLSGVVAALTFIFSMAPIFFALVLPYVAGDKLTAITRSPLLEPWMYPPQWGGMFRAICDRGLAGMWGSWWHQMFRYGISEPSVALLRKFGIHPKSFLGRSIQLTVAFALTGSIHMFAALTIFSIVPSKALHPMVFFLLQGVGITFQALWHDLVLKKLRLGLPKKIRQLGNFSFVLVWLWFTGPLLSDDFARSGIWLFEPVPFSVFRGLGFGPGDTWCPWLATPPGGKWVGFWNGGIWYRSGLAIY